MTKSMTQSWTDFKMVPMYVGECPRCGISQESFYDNQVNVVCSDCFYVEMNKDKQKFIDTIARLSDIQTNLSANDIDFVHENYGADLHEDKDTLVIIGKSGAQYTIHINSYQMRIKVVEQ